MRVSVCVATYNRAASLERLLRSLEQQGIDEVVVHDDASTDGTPEVLSRYDVVVLRSPANVGPAAGRNRAWRAATGDLVLFTDDDCVPQPGWAEAHVAAAATSRITVGRVGPDPAQQDLLGPFSRTMVVESTAAFATCNIGYPRALLEETGGFDEGYRRAAGEDTDLGLRAVELGAEAVFVPDALVHHDVRPSSWVAALKETRKWVDVPRFAARHEPIEGVLHSHRWWRQTHPVAVLAGAGVVGSAVTPYALLAVVPWVRLRTTHARVQARRRQWPWVLPATLAVDLAEVAVLARGSVKHRHLVL